MTPNQAQLGDNVTYDYALSQKEAITGSVTDFGLSTVALTTGTLPAVTQTTKSAFSFTIDATQFYDPTSFAPKNGALSQSTTPPYLPYKVPYTMIATDLAGNTTTISGNFYVKPGPGAPIFAFTSPSTILTNVYYPNTPPTTNIAAWKANTVLPGTPITCHLFDMDGLDTSATGLYIALAPSTTTNLDYTDAFNPGSPSTGYKVYTYGSSSNPLTLTPSTTLQLPGGTTITQGADITFTAPSKDGEYALLVT